MRQPTPTFALHFGATKVRREHVKHQRPREGDESSA